MPPPSWRRHLRNLRLVPVAILLVATGGFIGLYFQPPGLQWIITTLDLEPGGGTSRPIAVPRQRPLTEGSGTIPGTMTAPARRFVAGLGRILPETEIITLSAPFGASDARIAELRVTEGERVEAGSVLAVLDNERQLQATVEAARATVNSRQAMLAQTRAATLAARDEARAALARAQSTAQSAAREFQRADELRQRGFAADQTVDQRRTASDEANREVERLRATLSRYDADDIERQADVVVAARNLDSAEAELARAEADLEKAYVRSPIDATVLSIASRPGERPAATGMMNLGALERMKVEVEVYQTQIGQVALGQSVEVTGEALPQPLRGTVTRIGLEVGRQSVVDPNPAANTDARVVKVTVALDEQSTPIAARFTSLQVTARIMTGSAP